MVDPSLGLRAPGARRKTRDSSWRLAQRKRQYAVRSAASRLLRPPSLRLNPLVLNLDCSAVNGHCFPFRYSLPAAFPPSISSGRRSPHIRRVLPLNDHCNALHQALQYRTTRRTPQETTMHASGALARGDSVGNSGLSFESRR